MADFIAVDTDRSLDSEVADEPIKAGDPVVRKTGGGLRTLDPSSDTEVEYIAAYDRFGDHVQRYETDFTSYGDLYTYEAGDRVPLIPIVDKDVVRSLSVEDTSVAEPTFSANEIVGFISATNGPRLVVEGYTADFDGDGTTTTYNESNDNFVPLGEVDIRAPKKTQRSGYGEYIPARVDK